MKRHVVAAFVVAMVPLGALIAARPVAAEEAEMLVLEDFGQSPRPDMGIWCMFTDRVMGGVSDAEQAVTEVAGRPALRLTGTVSLANNGGFVQSAFTPRQALDGRPYTGLRLAVKGNGEEGYYVFLRTRATFMPWSFFSAPIPATTEWTDIEIPWSAFKRNSVWVGLNPGHIRQIGIVAYAREMQADIALGSMALYR
jgi:hypothetical protein